MKTLYVVWIKIDETLPWIELKGTFQTRGEAKKGAEELLNGIRVRFVKIQEKRRQAKALAAVKS